MLYFYGFPAVPVMPTNKYIMARSQCGKVHTKYELMGPLSLEFISTSINILRHFILLDYTSVMQAHNPTKYIRLPREPMYYN